MHQSTLEGGKMKYLKTLTLCGLLTYSGLKAQEIFSSEETRPKFESYQWAEEKWDNSHLSHFFFNAVGTPLLESSLKGLGVKHSFAWALTLSTCGGLVKEVIDGYRVGDKFSWKDITCNTAGNLYYVFVRVLSTKNKKSEKEKMWEEIKKELEGGDENSKE